MDTGKTLQPSTGKLIICPTPIGNLGDITQRVKEALQQADVVCAEDTRVTAKLLSAFDIHTPLKRLDENLMGTQAAAMVERVAEGQTIAYCSDAGMPGVSDPGSRLVAAAYEAGVPVEVLPGPSAVDTAYVASGFVNPRFYFGGFLPRKETERSALLAALKPLDAVLIFYESPNRLMASLAALAAAFPLRWVAVCRELTKLHEEVVRGLAPELLQEFTARLAIDPIRGEVVIVVDGPSPEESEEAHGSAREQARAKAVELADQGLRTKVIAKWLVAEFDLSRNEAYDLAMEVRDAGRASSEGPHTEVNGAE